MTISTLVFKKIENEDKTKCSTFYSHSKAELILNKSDINDLFKSVYTYVISNIEKPLRKGLDWIIDSVIDHSISILKYNPLAESIYQKN